MSRVFAGICAAAGLAAAQTVELRKQGDSIEAFAGPGASVEHRVRLLEGQFFYAQISGVRVSMETLDSLRRVAVNEGRTSYLAAGRPGEYTLIVRNASPTRQSYRITVLAWRDALPSDRQRIEAIGVLTAGYREAERATALSRKAALVHYDSARAIFRELGDSGYEARALQAKANVHTATGDTAAALQTLDEAIGLYSAVRDEGGEAVARVSAALMHVARSEYSKAFDNYQAALDYRTRRGDRRGEAEVLRNMAIAHASAKRFQLAHRMYADALDRFRLAGDRHQEAVTLVQIGELYLRLGDYTQAEAYAAQALPLHRADGNKTAEVHVLTNLGEVEAAKGNHRAALDRYNAAIRITTESGLGWQHANTQGLAAVSEEALGRLTRAESLFRQSLEPMRSHGNREGASWLLTRLGLLELERGRTAESARYLDEALTLAGGLPNREIEAMAVTAQARLARKRGDRAGAKKLAERAIEIVESIRARVESKELRATFLATRADWFEFYVALLAEDNDAGAAYRAAERSRARSLVEMLIEREGKAEMRSTEEPRLDASTALVEYFIGPSGAGVFVRSDAGVQMRRIASASAFVARVREIRALMEKPGRAQWAAFARASHELYQMCLAPIEGMIAAKKNLVVVADGPLHFVPFDALLTLAPGAGKPAFALRRWNIVYAPSASAFAAMQRKRAGTAEIEWVAFGNPEGDLPGAGEEVGQIARLFSAKRTEVFLGRRVTKQSVLAAANTGARRVHFAMHGAFRDGPRAVSGLVLANGDLLSPLDVLGSSWNADLVVLSACETALGPHLRGEGLQGMTRAFLYAGASSVAATLWPVDDAATRLLMTDFYRRVLSGSAPGDSLRSAKLSLLDSLPHAHPYYWAAFVFTTAT